MAYDLEEQEQLAALKAFWTKFGNLITWLLIIALGSYAGYNYWKRSQTSDALQASQLYEEMKKPEMTKEATKVLRAASDLQTRFGSTSYAAMGSLFAAKAAFDANDLKGAKAQLQWVIEHSKELELTATAKVRLAGILLDEKAYDEGLKVLAGEFPDSYAAMVADRKGDILVAQNKTEEARAAYSTALAKTDEKNPLRQMIQIKLDAIGGAKAA